MSSEKILNVTEVSSIVQCSREYFEDTVFKEPLTEYCLFIVESSSNSTLEVYYGSRKLKDIVVVNSYPSGRDYPNNKLYIRINTTGTIRDLIYKTSEGKLVVLTDDLLIKEVSRDHSSVEIIWSNDTPTSLVIVSVDGQATQIVADVVERSASQVQYKYSIKWEKIDSE